MINNSVKKIGDQLERLMDRDISITRAFDIIAKKSSSIEEIVVIEVMREVYAEMTENQAAIYADSKSRSARMPSMAFNR